MYIDTQFRAAKPPARTPEPRFSGASFATSLLVHALLAVGLVLIAHRAVLREPAPTPPIPMIFVPAPPPPAPAPPAPTLPPPAPAAAPASPPPAVEPLPPPPIPVPPIPPPPLVKEAPPAPTPKVEHRRAPPRRERHERRPPEHPRPARREAPPRVPATPEAFAPAQVAPMPRAAPPVAIETGPVVPPRPVSGGARTGLPYPEWAARAHEQGTVVLRIDVTAGGAVASVSVIRSTGYPRLDRYAIDAVRASRYFPATRGGRPVAGSAEQTFNFQLRDE